MESLLTWRLATRKSTGSCVFVDRYVAPDIGLQPTIEARLKPRRLAEEHLVRLEARGIYGRESTEAPPAPNCDNAVRTRKENVMVKRIVVAGVVVLVTAGIALAQQARELTLRGDRFKPLRWDRLTPAQKTMVNDLLAGTRTSLNGPFNALLRSPEMGNLSQKLGEYVRFRTSVPQRLNEMAILLTAKWWSSQYEWHAHKTLASNAGLNAAVIDDIQAGRRPSRMQSDETVIYDFVGELREHRRVSDATFKAAVNVLGEKGVMDLIAAMAYYDLVSMVLNVDRYPLPDGAQLPFPEPR